MWRCMACCGRACGLPHRAAQRVDVGSAAAVRPTRVLPGVGPCGPSRTHDHGYALGYQSYAAQDATVGVVIRRKRGGGAVSSVCDDVTTFQTVPGTRVERQTLALGSGPRRRWTVPGHVSGARAGGRAGDGVRLCRRASESVCVASWRT